MQQRHFDPVAGPTKPPSSSQQNDIQETFNLVQKLVGSTEDPEHQNLSENASKLYAALLGMKSLINSGDVKGPK